MLLAIAVSCIAPTCLLMKKKKIIKLKRKMFRNVTQSVQPICRIINCTTLSPLTEMQILQNMC